MANNKQLTATVRLNTTQFEKKLKRLSRAIDVMNRAVGKTSNVYNQVNSALKNTETTTKKVKSDTDKWATSAKKVNQHFKQGESTLARMSKSIRNMLAAYVGIMGTRFVLNSSDTITSAENKLNASNGNNTQLTQESMDKMYAASMRSRSSYAGMMSNVSKSMTLAGGAFDNDVDKAIKFQEIMAKSYAIGGASAAEQNSSMYQLVQALGSGVLQGDELRSVREGAPVAYKQIEKFAQGVYNTEESLKELASQGKITSEMVVAAIMDAETEINDTFNKSKMTFQQAGSMIGSMALQAFKPVLQMLNDALRSDVGQAMINGIGKAFVVLSNIILKVGEIIKVAIDWIVDNWDWLKTVLIVGIMAITAYLAIMGAAWLINFIIANWAILLVVGAISFMIYLLHQLGFTTNQIIGGICGAFMFLVYLIYDAVIWAITIIGLIFAAVWNLFVGVGTTIAMIAVLIVTYAILAFQGIVQIAQWLILAIWAILVTIYNIFYTIFMGAKAIVESVIISLYSTFADFGQMVLGVLLAIANAIDWVFGSNLGSTVEGWMNGLDESVIKLEQELDPNSEVESIKDQWKDSYSNLGDMFAGRGKYDDWNITDNMANVQNTSDGILNDIASTGDALTVDTDKILQFGLDNTQNPMDGWDKGFNFGNNLLDNFNSMFGGDLLDPYDAKYALDGGYDMEELLKGVENIDDNTTGIKDSMDLSKDDMDYLRKIAEMEWRNEFTTAEIRVDMTNNNTVTGERDLDGIVEYLSDVLRSEMTNVAYGVHY